MLKHCKLLFSVVVCLQMTGCVSTIGSLTTRSEIETYEIEKTDAEVAVIDVSGHEQILYFEKQNADGKTYGKRNDISYPERRDSIKFLPGNYKIGTKYYKKNGNYTRWANGAIIADLKAGQALKLDTQFISTAKGTKVLFWLVGKDGKYKSIPARR